MSKSNLGTMTVRQTLPQIKLVCKLFNLKVSNLKDFKIASGIVESQLN